MKLSPFEVLLRTLTGSRGGMKSMTKEQACLRLNRMTGQDFGMDVEAWRRWGIAHPELSGIEPHGGKPNETADSRVDNE